MKLGRVQSYLEMTKPSIMGLVLVTTVLGFYFALVSKGLALDFPRTIVLCWTLLGCALSCAGPQCSISTSSVMSTP